MSRRSFVAIVLWTLMSFRAGANEELLRNRWQTRELSSRLAQHIATHQSSCTRHVFYHEFGNSGMGSDIHVWTQALCNAMQNGATLLQVEQEWIWNDNESCPPLNYTQPLSCYFSQLSSCPYSLSNQVQVIDWLNRYDRCPAYITDLNSRQLFRAAAVEYLFSTIRPKMVKETENVAREIFGSSGIPDNMITVHVRWGDKRKEMDLVHQRDYVNAIQGLIDKHGIETPHIFITTESHIALSKLEKEVIKKRKPWTLHYYPAAVYHNEVEMSMASIASQSSGKLGRASLVSLLLAMEARYYVLTSGSNWSRLIDELRRNVVDADCGGCTDFVDLRRAIAKAQDW
jgi:hypothetical protein